MSEEIYLRRYRLRFGRPTGTLSYEMNPNPANPAGDGLRITFQVIHFAGNAFSVAEISIYNVADYAARQMLGDGITKKYQFISLEAGYAGSFGNVFLGQITNVQRILEDGGSTRGIKFFCRSQARARSAHHQPDPGARDRSGADHRRVRRKIRRRHPILR